MTEVPGLDHNDESLTVSESIAHAPCSLGNFVVSAWHYVKCCWQRVNLEGGFPRSDSAPTVELKSVRQSDSANFGRGQPLSLISLRNFGDEFRTPVSLTSEPNDEYQTNAANGWVHQHRNLPDVVAETKTVHSSLDEDEFSVVFDGGYVNFELKNTDYDWIFDAAVFGRVSLDATSAVLSPHDREALDETPGRSRALEASPLRRPSETLPDTARSSGYSSRLTDVDNSSATATSTFSVTKYFENKAFVVTEIENGASDGLALDQSNFSQITNSTESADGKAFETNSLHTQGNEECFLSSMLDFSVINEKLESHSPQSADRCSENVQKTGSTAFENFELRRIESDPEFSELNVPRAQSFSNQESDNSVRTESSEDVQNTSSSSGSLTDTVTLSSRFRNTCVDSKSLISRRTGSTPDELGTVLRKLDDHSEKVTAKPLLSPVLISPADMFVPRTNFFDNFSFEFEPLSLDTPAVGKCDKIPETLNTSFGAAHSLPEPTEAQGQSFLSPTSATTSLTVQIPVPRPSSEFVLSEDPSLREMEAPGVLSDENLEAEVDTAILESEVAHILMYSDTVFKNGLESLSMRRLSGKSIGRSSVSMRSIQGSNHLDEELETLRHLSANQRRSILLRRISAVNQVTSLLLEGQTRKLVALQWELESSAAAPSTQGSLKAKEQLRRQLITSIERVQFQFDQLEREYTHQALGRLRNSGKSNRSQPAIGLKQTHKTRPTIFGTVAGDQCPKDSTKRGLPQTPKGGGLRGGHGGQDAASTPEWATLPDDDNSLVYEDGVLVSGSLQALVQHATPTSSYYPDTAYLFAFLLSSRLFIKPHDLLQRVSDLGFTQQGLQDDDDISAVDKDKLEKFVVHIVQLLGEWSETFPYDFRDERVMSCVRNITHRCIALQPNLRRDVTQILHNLLNKLTHLERYEESLAKLTVAPPADSLSDVPDITDICNSPLVMAQQLTHIELERLSFIGPEEFVQAFAKDSNIDSSYKDLKKTNNLEVYVQWFNKLSYSVATQAVSHLKKKQRVRVIEWWIEVARECFNIGNFNSLMGIIAGLNMSPVSRLKKTWSKVQTAKFSVLEHQMDPTSNFSSYRSTLKAAMWRSAGAVDDRQKIVIPFFSLLVKDLYFLNEGCANRLPNGYINFDKFWQLAKQVTEFMAWKQVTCPFERVPHVINYLQSASILSEIGLAHASFECEGPENSYEKERYKNLHRVESQASS